MASESNSHVSVRGPELDELLQQPVLVGWKDETKGQYQHIGCLSTSTPRNRANLTLWIGRAPVRGQGLLINLHLPVNTRATQNKTEKNMYLVIPIEHLHLEFDVVDFEDIPRVTRSQLKHNCSEEIRNGLVHARFTLSVPAFVVMPKLRRKLARPLTGAPSQLISSLKALTDIQEFDMYFPRGDAEHQLQVIRFMIERDDLKTPDLDLQATYRGGFGGGKNIWEYYPCLDADNGNVAWNPFVDDEPPSYDAVINNKIPTQASNTLEKVSLHKPEKRSFEASPASSKLTWRVGSGPSDGYMRVTDTKPQMPSASAHGHKRKAKEAISDDEGAVQKKTPAPQEEPPQDQGTYSETTEEGPSPAAPPEQQGQMLSQDPAIHQDDAGSQPPDQLLVYYSPTDPDLNPARDPTPTTEQDAHLVHTAVLACLRARAPHHHSSPSSSSSPDPALLCTPHLFLELKEWLATAAQLEPAAHDAYRPHFLTLGAAARAGQTAVFDARLRDCQRRLLRDAWSRCPPADEMVEEALELLDWLRERMGRVAGTVMMPCLVALRGCAQRCGMLGGLGAVDGEQVWREGVAEVRAVAFWGLGGCV